MSFNNSQSSSFTKLLITMEFILVAYLIYSLTRNVYNSYLVDQYIEDFRAENLRFEQENIKQQEDYLYFTSEEYIDKIAKQTLDLVNPGEEVIVLTPDALAEPSLEEVEMANKLPSGVVGQPVYKQWQIFFFGD